MKWYRSGSQQTGRGNDPSRWMAYIWSLHGCTSVHRAQRYSDQCQSRSVGTGQSLVAAGTAMDLSRCRAAPKHGHQTMRQKRRRLSCNSCRSEIVVRFIQSHPTIPHPNPPHPIQSNPAPPPPVPSPPASPHPTPPHPTPSDPILPHPIPSARISYCTRPSCAV